MKKILVISDSHGGEDKVNSLINTCAYDYVFFLGDGLSDVQNIAVDKLVAVSGNCDYFSTIATEQILKIEEVKVLITHGHKYGVKSGLGGLIKRACEVNANLVCYGHTHVKNLVEVNGITFLNPGSLKGWQEGKGNYYEVIIEKEKIYINM